MPHEAFLVLSTMEAKLTEFSAGSELGSLNARVAKAFNALRQRVRKVITQYGEEIKRAEQAVDEECDQEDDAAAAAVLASRMELQKVTELRPDTLLKRLQEINSMRGRKHVDKHDNLATLRKMLSMAQSRRHKAHILAALVVANLEVSSANLGYIPVESFTLLVGDLSNLNAVMREEQAAGAWVELMPDEEEHALTIMSGVRSTIISYTQRVDDEFIRALQNVDPHSNEYVDFLRLEPAVFQLLDNGRRMLMELPDQSELICQLVVRQLEHIYHRSRDVVAKYFDNHLSLLDHCRYLHDHGGEKQRTRALLYHIYWLAIHENYHKARDLMLHSHIQETLSSLDIPTQILYNRTLVQVGMAAFRSGHFKETYFALQELCSTGRPKELLAQGMVGQKYTEKGELDRNERQRLVPFHMQINVEMIDCIFLTVSMLLEVPQSAAAGRRYFCGERRLFQSRHLRRILDSHERNLFNGPPENTREFIVAGARALANGSWRRCEEYMMQIKVWDSLPNPVAVRKMIQHKIREAGLYAFMYTSGSSYSALSVERLAKEYDLPIALVVRIVSHLIGDFGVPAMLSEDASHIMWRADCDPSPTQEMILLLKDKIMAMEERNHGTADLFSQLQHAHAISLRNQESLREQAAASHSSVPQGTPATLPA